MSKEAAVRAMREARYAERTAPRAAPARPAAPAARPPVAPPSPESATDDQTCGHRSMNGRSCTREKDHAAKNHRYS